MNKTLIWASSENIIEKYELDKYSYLFSTFIKSTTNTPFKVVVKQMKICGAEKIIKISNDLKFEIIYKKNSVWSSVKFDDIITNWHFQNKLKPIMDSEMKNIFFLDEKKQSDIKFPYEISDELDNLKKVFKSLLTDYSLKNSISSENKSTYTLNLKIPVESKETFDNLASKVVKSNIRGIQRESAEKLGNDILIIKTKFGNIVVKYNDDGYVFISSILESEEKNISELFSFSKVMSTNISNYINNNLSDPTAFRKITKANIFAWTLSVAVLIILSWITFNFIISPSNSGTAIKIIFSKYSWTHIWSYLMWINFFISLFIMPIIAIIFIKAQDPKRKISVKQHMNIFLSAQVRTTVVFITGNPLLGTIVWGWYLNASRDVKVINFVGMVVSVNIVRGAIIIPIGSAFMIRGTIFNHTIFSELGMMNKYYWFVFMSWVGWIWHTIEHLAITLLVIFPPLHMLYNKFLFVKYRNNTNSSALIEKFTSFEMSLISLKHSYKDIFKNRERLLRMSITMSLMILIETFEFTFGLKMVEGYSVNSGYLDSAANYWNVFAISGVRYMSGFVKDFPFLQLIPGQGLGITEIALKTYTMGVINHAHNGLLEINKVEALSQQSTFIMRFFNFYLKRIIGLIVCLFIIPIAINKRNKRLAERRT